MEFCPLLICIFLQCRNNNLHKNFCPAINKQKQSRLHNWPNTLTVLSLAAFYLCQWPLSTHAGGAALAEFDVDRNQRMSFFRRVWKYAARVPLMRFPLVLERRTSTTDWLNQWLDDLLVVVIYPSMQGQAGAGWSRRTGHSAVAHWRALAPKRATPGEI